MASSVIVTSTFNQLSQHAISPGHRAYCYAKLAVFFPSGSHNHLLISPTHVGMTSWVPSIHPSLFGLGGLVKYEYGVPANDHPSQY